jgi:germination protein YpeB
MIFLSAILCLTFVTLNNKSKLIASHKQFLENSYERSFYETVNYLHDVENLLSKVQLTQLPNQNINVFAQIWRSASAAHDNLSTLPYNYQLISKVLKYLSQTSDFSYAMMNKSIDNKELTQEEWKTLNDLQKYAKDLSQEMEDILTSSNVYEKIDWDKLMDENLSGSAYVLSGSMQNVSKQFQDYGELIYDGPFSDHIQNIAPKMLEGKTEITKSEGLEIAKKILSDLDIKNIEYSGETTTKKSMVTYSYLAKNNDDGQIYLEVTKKGGYPLLMISEPPKNISDNKISNYEAIKIAKNFLNENNFTDMKESYYEQFENFLTINFAPFIENVIMYPDLIKVKINLATGKIAGFETLGYLTMHCEREAEIPSLSQAAALELIPPDFEIKSIKQCIIPLDSKKEVSCYEINGMFHANEFMIYVNTNSGKFEKIYRLVVNERGTLSE